jgi:hypothetical protein
VSTPVASCPSCGAPVEFRWAGAVQTVCGYCSSILVRHDVELERVGKVSEPPPVTSRIQLGTRGRYRDRPFTVGGRIAYTWERGGWSEWHVVFSEGRSGWLSDALDEHAVSFLATPRTPLPPADRVRVGDRLTHEGKTYQVATLTRARYAGVEGELPFEYWDREEVLFADLKGEAGFATLDYSDPEPLLFVGEYVDFRDLHLTELREPEEKRVAGVAALNCPNCGGAVEIRDPEHTVNVVCPSCTSVLDARSAGLRVLQRAGAAQKVDPMIPLGSKGRWKGEEYRVLGFQQRTIRVEGVDYSWREYLLHGPAEGYRYLTEYAGHWNDAIPLKSLPTVKHAGGRPVATLHGQAFKHFQTATAKTSYVLGEFPWEVRVGDTAKVHDYVAPPRLLSWEETESESSWSLGEYVPGARVWEAFRLPGKPPEPQGVFANQPSPHAGRAWGVWGGFALLVVLLLVLWIGRAIVSPPQPVYEGSYVYEPSVAGWSLEGDGSATSPAQGTVVVTEPFTLGGRPSNLEVSLRTDVNNSWAFFNFALLDQETGKAIEFGREVSFYHGVDQGDRWSEGDSDDRVLVPTVSPGRYVLRIAPEGPQRVEYTLRLRRDVPNGVFYAIAFLLLLVPPVFLSLRAGSFEKSRWAESDYAPEDDD